MAEDEEIPAEWVRACDEFVAYLSKAWPQVSYIHEQIAKDAQAHGIDPNFSLTIASLAAIGSFLSGNGWQLIPPSNESEN